MQQPIQYRVFSLSSEDVFPEGNLDFAKNWLRNKGNKPYYFREKKPRNLSVGSHVLFSFEGQIFGRAITDELVISLSEKEQKQKEKETGFLYTGSVRFKPERTDVFDDIILKREITKKHGVVFNRNFTKLTKEEFQDILKMVGRKL